MLKPKVLVMVDWYAPGFKAGGPIRSAVNFADQLEHDLDIYVLTTDRDLGEPEPYSDITTDRWVSRGSHQVYYASPANLGWKTTREIILGVEPDCIYLNSMFSLHFTIYPLLMKKLGMVKARIVLAPRGMLRASALAHKPGKKKLFLNMFRFMGLPKLILFHATDQTEEQDIRRIFGPGSSLFQAGNLPGKQKPFRPPEGKRKGNLRLVFVGRIHPIKNLDFLLLALQGITGTVELTVIATLEDEVYWKYCQSIMDAFPPAISVKMLIDLPHDRIEENILAAHAFALPTKGENFGHSIFEALAAGRPVLISDQTPWRNLPEDHAGWDLPLGDPAPFRRVIQELVDMDAPALETWCLGAWNKAKDYLSNTSTRSTILKVFADTNTMP